MSIQTMGRRAGYLVLFATVVSVLSACASAPVPSEQISLSTNAVNRAVSAGATEYAPEQMKTAQDKMFLMERAVGEKNYAQAKILAEQIEVDAALAERTARTAKTQKQLRDAQSGIQVLKQEMLQAPDSAPSPSGPCFNQGVLHACFTIVPCRLRNHARAGGLCRDSRESSVDRGATTFFQTPEPALIEHPGGAGNQGRLHGAWQGRPAVHTRP